MDRETEEIFAEQLSQAEQQLETLKAKVQRLMQLFYLREVGRLAEEEHAEIRKVISEVGELVK